MIRFALSALCRGTTLVTPPLPTRSILGDDAKREVDALDILWPCLRVHIALRGRDPRVPKEVLDEARVGVPSDEAARGVA